MEGYRDAVRRDLNRFPVAGVDGAAEDRINPGHMGLLSVRRVSSCG